MPAIKDDTADLEFVIALVYERSRIRLHEGKEALIRARLGKRVRLLGYDSLHSYCDFLRHEADEEELIQVVDALATNFTGFLREKDHFEYLVREALPAVLPSGQRRIQVWSAACSTGEEPYSLAFYLGEHHPVSAGWDWSIYATDISTKALDKARSAVYPAERLEAIPVEWRRRYFQRGVGQWEGQVRVKEWVRERVRFAQVNLLGGFQCDRMFETIFCRNVMIYFDRPTQQELVRHLVRFLVPGGYFMTGHSESLNGLSVGLRCLRPSIYQKV